MRNTYRIFASTITYWELRVCGFVILNGLTIDQVLMSPAREDHPNRRQSSKALKMKRKADPSFGSTLNSNAPYDDGNIVDATEQDEELEEDDFIENIQDNIEADLGAM